MASATELMASALRVLRTFASLVASVLLALDLAGIARDESRLLQHTPEPRMGEHERTRGPVPDRGGLRRYTAAADVHREVVLAAGVGELERLMHDHPRRLASEIVLEGSVVDDQLAVTHRHSD